MMIDSITLVSPPSLFLGVPKALPPVGLLYLAGAIREKAPDVDIKIMDLADQNELPRIADDVVGISFTTPHWGVVKSLIDRFIYGAVILGGAHPTALPHETLNEMDVWAVVKGYGERRIVELLNRDDVGSDYKILLEDNFGDVSPSEPLDKYVPLPAYDLIDIHAYNPEMEGGDAMTVFTSRGCPHNCAFCASKLFCNRKVWFFSIERVIEDIRTLKNEYGFENIYFGDDTFTLKRSRLKKLCEALAKEELNYKCMARIDTINKEVLGWLKDAGFTEISYGVESGSNRMLKLMNKGITAKLSEKVVRMTMDAGIITKAFFISGFPGETLETISETIEWFDRVLPDKWLLSQFVPYPGTSVFNVPEKYGVTFIDKNWNHYQMLAREGNTPVVYETETFGREEIRMFYEILWNHFQGKKEMRR